MMDYSMLKQMEMWKATNFAAQIAQMKAAGLSPGLIYGMKGGGGITTGSPGGAVTGANAPVGGGEIQTIMGQGMNLQLMQAQKDLLKAQADNLNANTEKTSGVDTDKVIMDMADLAETIQNKQVQRSLLRAQARFEDVQATIAEKTQDEAIDTIVAAMGKAQEEVMQAEVKTKIDRATQNDVIDTVRRQYIRLGLENALTRAQTDTEKGKPGLQKAEIQLIQGQLDKISADIVQNWEKLLIEGLDQNARERLINNAVGNADMPDSSKELINNIKGILQAIILKQGLSQGHIPIKGFSK